MVELDITGLSNSGEGIGRLDNKIYFVPGSVPGDKVEIKITQSKKTFAKGSINRIVSPSPDRILPECPHFGTCGGCDWQNLPISIQRDWKCKNLLQTLIRIGGIQSPPMEPIIFGKKEFFYRNRIRGVVKNGSFHFHRKSSSDLIPIDRCYIADEQINSAISQKSFTDKGKVVEIGVTDKGVLVLPVDSSRTTSEGFRQVNAEMVRAMENIIISSVYSGSPNVLDLYCGSGTWTFPLAKNFSQKKILGIDINPFNIEKAKKLNSLPNLDFILGDAKDSWPTDFQKNCTVIVDPPRAGLSKELITILGFREPRTIVYISCHPATLARDLKSLGEKGFVVQKVTPVDMFPQTRHLETIVALRHISS